MRNAPKLKDKTVQQAKPKNKAYRLYDAYGLYLEISPAGGKLWRLKYRFDGKEKRLALGQYPAVTLKEARDKAHAARKLLERGIDPGAKTPGAEKKLLFRDLAHEWWVRFAATASPRYAKGVWSSLEREAFPALGNMPIEAITAVDVLNVLRQVEDKGAYAATHKLKSHINQVYKYSIARGITLINPARDLAGALIPFKSTHMGALIDPLEVGGLMRAIDGYGRGIVRSALKLAALTFVRPGELRAAAWSEIDFATREWRIPAEKMKMKRPHLVPLSDQALAVLMELKQLTGHYEHLFPSIKNTSKHMGGGVINTALRALGYSSDKMTGHGFRAMASSLLSEQGWSVEVIERQLAHMEKNKVRAAYHRSEHLEERRKMMQAWGNYLDSLRNNC